MLAVAPGRLTLERLIGIFEAKATSARCLLGDRPCNKHKPCVAHNMWTAINRSHDQALESTTVADLLGQ
jgi:DNA-binding IscR family transcriptional regulator